MIYSPNLDPSASEILPAISDVHKCHVRDMDLQKLRKADTV